MGILNNTSDGFANILLIICKYLIKHGPQDKDELMHLFIIGTKEENPSNSSDNAIKHTINRWIQLDLFAVNENKIYFSKKSQQYFQKIKLNNLTSLIRKIVFSRDNNQNLLSSEKSKSADFTSALSWMMSQQIFEEKTYLELMNTQIKVLEKRPIQNPTRYNRLTEYMHVLGFASGNENNFLIDPTQAIEEELYNVFDNQNILSFKEFIEKLAQEIPVLDHGIYRKEIEEHLRSDTLKKTDDLQLSSTLSFALLRLEQKEKILLQTKGDADVAFKLWNFSKEINIEKQFSHIELKRENNE